MDDLPIPEHTHGDDDEANAVGQFRDVKAETGHTRVHIGTHHAQQEAQHNHGHRLDQRARGQHHRTNQAQNHQTEVLGRAELEGQLGQGRCKGGQDQGTHTTGKEGAHAGSGQGGACSAVTGHLVTVNHRHDGRRLPGQVDQDGGSRPTVLGAVVDTGQHDQGGDGRQGIGGRQQHGNGGQGANAGQDADQGAEQTADEGVDQVLEGEGHTKTEGEVVKEFHGAVSSGGDLGSEISRPDRELQLEQHDEG